MTTKEKIIEIISGLGVPPELAELKADEIINEVNESLKRCASCYPDDPLKCGNGFDCDELLISASPYEGNSNCRFQ